MGAPAAVAAVSVGGGILSAWSQVESGRAQRKAAERNAALKRMQADELLERANINMGEVFREGRVMAGTQASSYAAAGVGLDGTPLLVIEETLARASEEASLIRRDAEFQAKMLRLGADIEVQQGKSMEKAAYIGAAGNLISSGVNAAKAGGLV